MKPYSKISIVLISFTFCFSLSSGANAQLLKKLKKKAERTVERKLEQKTEKETGKAMDSILDPNEKTSKNDNSQGGSSSQGSGNSPSSTGSDSKVEINNPNVSDNLEVYKKYDFVPGDKVLFFDDFSQDFVGDFPSKWNTNATGEVVRINNSENWFELKSGYGVYYLPSTPQLPEDFSLEFDLLAAGLDKNTSSTARLNIIFSDNQEFKAGSEHYVEVSIPLGQYAEFPLRAKNYFNNKTGSINTDIQADIRDEVLNQPHIAVSVTKNRYRLWINEEKYVDIPQFVAELDKLKYVKFHINHFKDGKEHVYINNIKIAEGGVDLRRKLLSEGKISTNGILFDSGSANIKPQSLGIVMQISQVLLQDNSMKLKIVGHTDSDGGDDANLKLSKARAEAVKHALVNIYNISAERLQTDGKGESAPVADNSTADGKSQNRRVEFIKI